MATYFWDTLQLTLSADEEGFESVKVMYDKDELRPGYNLMRGRRLNRKIADLPKMIARQCTDFEFTFDVFYKNSKNIKESFTLHFEERPQIKIIIGNTKRPINLELHLVDFNEENDDDGRYDAWA